MHVRKVAKIEEADAGALRITLYRKDGLVRGWFMGPVSISDTSVEMAYLPKSRNLLAAVAVVRAKRICDEQHLDICVIDPEDLWSEAWAQAPQRRLSSPARKRRPHSKRPTS